VQRTIASYMDSHNPHQAGPREVARRPTFKSLVKAFRGSARTTSIAGERKGALCLNTLASSEIKIGLTPIRAGWSLGSRGTSHPFGRPSEGTDLRRSAENARLRVGPYPPATLITSNSTAVNGRFSCNTRTPKVYVFTTTMRTGVKRDPAERPRLAGAQANPNLGQGIPPSARHTLVLGTEDRSWQVSAQGARG
jgi:hypothetical protein